METFSATRDHILFWLTWLLMTIIILNLLIGVLSDEMTKFLHSESLEKFAELNDIILENEYRRFYHWSCFSGDKE